MLHLRIIISWSCNIKNVSSSWIWLQIKTHECEVSQCEFELMWSECSVCPLDSEFSPRGREAS